MKTEKASVHLGTFILLVILVAVCFGGAGYLYGTKTVLIKSTATKTATATSSAVASKTARSSATKTATDTTADWKTYTNDTLGFSIKYPTDLYYKLLTNDIENRNSYNFVISDVKEMGVQDILDSEKIHVNIGKTKETLEEAQGQVRGGSAADSVQIGSIKAKKVVDVSSPSAADAKSTTQVTYLVPAGDYVFTLVAANNDTSVKGNEKDSNFALMEQIIGTFELTK